MVSSANRSGLLHSWSPHPLRSCARHVPPQRIPAAHERSGSSHSAASGGGATARAAGRRCSPLRPCRTSSLPLLPPRLRAPRCGTPEVLAARAAASFCSSVISSAAVISCEPSLRIGQQLLDNHALRDDGLELVVDEVDRVDLRPLIALDDRPRHLRNVVEIHLQQKRQDARRRPRSAGRDDESSS